MIIYPAIDILGGRCVRLLKGEYDKVTEYGANPVEIALMFEAAGATHLHIVDLDGAKSGTGENTRFIREVCKKTSLKVQTGGGIRSLDRIDELIQAGVDRVVLGTAAIQHPEFVQKAVSIFNSSIVVGIDSRNDMAATDGWTKVSDKNAFDVALTMKKNGITSIVYTDISKDGMMSGPDLKGLKKMIDMTGLNIVASGGIRDIEDVKRVKRIGAYAAIIGKAIYEKAIDLQELFKLQEKDDKWKINR